MTKEIEKAIAVKKAALKKLELATKLVKEFDLIRLNKTYYNFNGAIWEKKNSKIIEAKIQSEMIIDDICSSINTVNEVCGQVELQTHIIYGDQIENIGKNGVKKHEIYCKSGKLDVFTKKLTPYTKDDFIFTSLPFDYNKKAPKLDAFEKFMMSTFKDDSKDMIGFIQEWLGYSLLMGNPFEKALIMIGEGRNGKGVLLHVWKHLVGNDNLSVADLKSLNNEKQIAITKNKLLNICGDMEQGQQLDTGVVKSAISGEEVFADEKYKEPHYFTFTAKIVMACNDLPFPKKVGTAVKERFMILPFDQEFIGKNQDRNLKHNLETELEGIFTWAVNGLERLLKRGHFIIPGPCAKSLDKYIEEHDSVGMWIKEDEDLVKGEDSKIKPKELYTRYKDFCIESGKKGYSKTRFYQRLEVLGYERHEIQGYEWFVGIGVGDTSYNKVQEFYKN